MAQNGSSVVLDTTLAELYEVDKGVSVVLCPQALVLLPDASNRISSNLHYHDDRIIRPKESITPKEEEEEVNEANKFYSSRGQRNAFIGGRMKVVFFDSNTKLDPNDGRKDAELTTSVLCEEQQPNMVFLSSFNDLVLDEIKDERLAVLLPVDGLAKHSQVIDPGKLWELLSKRALAVSGLPTPKAEILDVENEGEAVYQEEFKERALNRLCTRPLPFVVKLQQTIAGFGAWIILTEEDRTSVFKNFSDAVIPNLLQKVLPGNRHLHPATLILTNYIKSEQSIGIAFFVKKSGEAVFISGSVQKFDENQHYDGSVLNFAVQDSYRSEYSGLINEVATFLHKNGYYGPAGIDIIEDQHTAKPYIVDLNVRIAGSIIVGLLSKHFTNRGLNWACLEEDVRFPFSRETFQDKMKTEIEEGRLVIVVWHAEWKSGEGIGCFVLGAETADGLRRFLIRLKGLKK